MDKIEVLPWHCIEPSLFYFVVVLFLIYHILSLFVLYSSKSLGLRFKAKDKLFYLSIFIPFLSSILLYVSIIKVEYIFTWLNRFGLDIEEIK